MIEDEGKDFKRVLFTSTYGTGKTILLKAKIRKLQDESKGDLMNHSVISSHIQW